ncbi:CopG family transcriptional regulator [Mammaliicoccus sp. F-M27]|uniref:CopG family transcriptional regulator n=1 Tax=Mammaliicoccus sp. F-M27 TaxID=2898687 RepID=UPI001EFAE9E3|nr:CopG family transcriptional regulator [Mammaliicoccus sp. F-M27]
MAFDPTKKSVDNQRDVEENKSGIAQALQSSKNELDKIGYGQSIIKKKDKQETRSRYNFTLKPSNREKLNRIYKENNYSSASEFLDELIESL